MTSPVGVDLETMPVGPECPHPVERAVMVMDWNTLTFIHWRVDVDSVQRLLPPGLTVELIDGEAWVALVPFEMRVTLPRAPMVPWVSAFPETNVRTYVRGPDGTVGVWFLSLDAARLAAVITARASYRLPYFWSAMTVCQAGDVVTYRCRRRIPGPRGARSAVAVRVGAPYEPDELVDRDHWMTARWRLFSASPERRGADSSPERRGADGPMAGPRGAWAEHPVWPLHRAELLHCDDELVRASGLEPVGDPVVHFSPGVRVRVSRPARCEVLARDPIA